MITPQERRRLVMERDRRRKHMERLRCGETGTTAWNMKPAAVLVPWHTDEHGCRARTVGNEGT